MHSEVVLFVKRVLWQSELNVSTSLIYVQDLKTGSQGFVPASQLVIVWHVSEQLT